MFKTFRLLAPEGAVAAPPPKSTPQPTAPQLTPEQKAEGEKNLAEFTSDFLGEKIDPVKPKAKKKEQPPKAAPKPAATTPPPPQPVLNAEQIAAAAAEGVARAIAPPKKEAETKPEPELDEAEKKRVSVLERMETLYPDKYKGKPAEWKAYLSDLAKYAADWEKEHPDQDFNPESPEHEDEILKMQPDWDDEHYTEALADIKAEQRLKPTEERLSAYEKAEKRRQKLAESAPDINTEQVGGAKTFWKSLGDQFSEIIKEDGTFDIEKAKGLAESNPEAYALYLDLAKAIHAETAEMFKIMNGLADFDENNPVHVAMGNFAKEQEDLIAAMPAVEQLDQHQRPFMPAAKYWRLSKAERERYWTFSATNLSRLRAAQLADAGKRQIAAAEESHRLWAKSRGINLESVQQKGNEAPEPETEEAPEPDESKPKSPEAGGATNISARRSQRSEAPPDALTKFAMGLIE